MDLWPEWKQGKPQALPTMMACKRPTSVLGLFAPSDQPLWRAQPACLEPPNAPFSNGLKASSTGQWRRSLPGSILILLGGPTAAAHGAEKLTMPVDE